MLLPLLPILEEVPKYGVDAQFLSIVVEFFPATSKVSHNVCPTRP